MKESNATASPEVHLGGSKLISIRLGDDYLRRVDLVQQHLQGKRGPGAKAVTRTEVIQILLEAGLEKLGFAEPR